MFKNLPGPPHHAIWGHFLVMRDIASSLQPDATPRLFAHLMHQRYGLGYFFYLDLWSLAPPQPVIVQPELTMQVVQKMNLPKGSVVITYLFIILINNCATMHREDLFKDAERFYPKGQKYVLSV